MATISVTNPSDGQTIDASDVATPINTIVAAINGNLDNDNIKSGANIDGTKLASNTTALSVLDANGRGGWIAGVLPAPNTVTYNGNRNYSLVFNSTDLTGYISNGMRLRLTRTVAAPTQCTSLNGTTQYYSKSSPSAMTFTDDFTVSAWIKLSSYANGVIAARWNGTSGWYFIVTSTGQLQLAGTNAASANFSYVQSYQSVPLNKWVHVAAQLDMSTFTATTTTSYVMIDGLDAPASVVRGGTNPTALVQAGNLEIGATVAGTQWFFPGKIAQVAIYNAKVTQATVAASISQTLSGSETSLISAYSFNNTINDLSANANNLTANGSAVATNADSPYANAQTAGTLEYGEVFNASFSTNTTLVVQVPDGCMIPTSGGITAAAYSTVAKPYGWPGDISVIGYAQLCSNATVTSTTAAAVSGLSIAPYVPQGRKVKITFFTGVGLTNSGANNSSASICVGSAADANRISQVNEGLGTAALGVTVTTYDQVPGSRTYVATASSNAGTITVNTATVSPAYIIAELV